MEVGETDKNEIEINIEQPILNQEENNFILKATDGEEEYILHLKYSDYINLVERDFSKICNNFQLLFSKLKSSIENKKVAIKEISKKNEEISQDRLRHYINEEVNTMKKCESENSVKLLDFFEEDDNYFIIME